MHSLNDLGEQLYMFDLLEQGEVGRSSGYLYDGPKKVLIETGSAPCHPQILGALAERNLTPRDLDYVIVTHIHLDHAGGAGLLSTIAPQATFVAQKRAARHLVDPTRLIQGAKMVYGEDMEKYFGRILPVPGDRVLIREDGESLDLGDRILTFFDTPGHAKHHFSIFDADRKAIFSGDALGIRYVKQFTGWNFECVFPSTSPTDFDPDGVAYTVEKLRRLAAETVYHTHFGPSPAQEALDMTLRGAMAFARVAKESYQAETGWEPVRAALCDYLAGALKRYSTAPLDVERLGIDLEINAKGLAYYLAQARA